MTLEERLTARLRRWWGDPGEDVSIPVAELMADIQAATETPAVPPRVPGARDPEKWKAYMRNYMAQKRAKAKAQLAPKPRRKKA